MDPVLALVELRGAARLEALMRLGVTWPAVRRALELGRIQRIAPGTYSLPGADKAIIAAAALRGQLTCLNACDWWGLKSVTRPDAIHVVVPSSRGVARSRLEYLGIFGLHREPDFTPNRVIATVESALDHAARCTRPIEHLVLVDSALKKGLLDPHALERVCTRDAKRARWIARMATRLADSPPETVARAVLDAAGLHPVAQEEHDGVGHIDLGVGGRHGIEIDGWDPHSTREAFAEDRRRDREMAAQGKWSLRFTYWGVMRDPGAFALEVARITGLRVDARFESRMAWLMAVPRGHLNRRTQWRTN